ncbi:MAG: copper amine oxidase N-terminal domain-containing protein, partial [Eubacterium sp.]|nr:copper amine oxidase N-terminal domain-containing protein [Eubacterium sp.]
VKYTIEREDHSVYDSSGNCILTAYYDKVIIDSSYQYADKINAAIQADYEKYGNESISSSIDYAKTAFGESIQTENTGLSDTATADVVKDGGGILSIKISTAQVLGWTSFAVVTGNYGLNFNLNTGEKLDIASVYSKSESEMISFFKAYTSDYIDELIASMPAGFVYSDAKDIANSYSLSDFKYYLEGDSLILCYDKFTFVSSGNSSCAEIICPFVNVNIPYTGAEESITLIINGQEAETDVSPYIENGSTMVPVKVIADALRLSADYDSASKTVILSNDSTAIVLVIGSSNAVVNNSVTTLTSPAVIKDGRTMIPLRFCVEAFGAAADWNPDTKTVTITF